MTDDDGTCCVCLNEPATHAVVPCGHMCVCARCSDMLPKGRPCPLCRVDIVMVIKIYRPFYEGALAKRRKQEPAASLSTSEYAELHKPQSEYNSDAFLNSLVQGREADATDGHLYITIYGFAGGGNGRCGGWNNAAFVAKCGSDQIYTLVTSYGDYAIAGPSDRVKPHIYPRSEMYLCDAPYTFYLCGRQSKTDPYCMTYEKAHIQALLSPVFGSIYAFDMRAINGIGLTPTLRTRFRVLTTAELSHDDFFNMNFRYTESNIAGAPRVHVVIQERKNDDWCARLGSKKI